MLTDTSTAAGRAILLHDRYRDLSAVHRASVRW